MVERWIKPLGIGWIEQQVIDAIEAWEQAFGMRLPDDYRNFMTRYNGGRVYPLIFTHTAREPGGAPDKTEHFVDPIDDWEGVVARRAELADRLPYGTLVIGSDPGLIEIILSLRPHDHGHVYSWVRNFGGNWSSPDNDYLCLQAASFREFIEGLSENSDRDGYGYWEMQPGQPEAFRLEA